MEVIADHQLVRPADLEPGTCFLCRVNDVPIVGLAVQEQARRHPGEMAFVALSPGHLDLKNIPGLYNTTVIHGRYVLALPGARVVPTAEPGSIDTNSSALEVPAGALLLVAGIYYLSAMVSSSHARLFSLQDGNQANMDVSDGVVFSSWKIVQEDENGEHQELCSIRAAG